MVLHQLPALAGRCRLLGVWPVVLCAPHSLTDNRRSNAGPLLAAGPGGLNNRSDLWRTCDAVTQHQKGVARAFSLCHRQAGRGRRPVRSAGTLNILHNALAQSVSFAQVRRNGADWTGLVVARTSKEGRMDAGGGRYRRERDSESEGGCGSVGSIVKHISCHNFIPAGNE